MLVDELDLSCYLANESRLVGHCDFEYVLVLQFSGENNSIYETDILP